MKNTKQIRILPQAERFDAIIASREDFIYKILFGGQILESRKQKKTIC